MIEGYERIKIILKISYGKLSEVGNVYMYYWVIFDFWFLFNKNLCFLWEIDNLYVGLWVSLRRFVVLFV